MIIFFQDAGASVGGVGGISVSGVGDGVGKPGAVATATKTKALRNIA
jgi:hypothetical protein